MVQGDGRKPCCIPAAGNLYIFDRKPGMVIYKCKVCQCRHFEVTVDPIKVFGRGEGMVAKVIPDWSKLSPNFTFKEEQGEDKNK